MDARAADSRQAARAIDALRRGWPIGLAGAEGALTLLPIEGATPASLAAFDPDARAPLLISASRAVTLKLVNQLAAADTAAPVLIARDRWIDGPAAAMAIADPVSDLATPFKGPFRALPLVHGDAAIAALELARLAGLLPAYFVGEADAPVEARCTVGDIAAFSDASSLMIAARARLPIDAKVDSEIIAFRSTQDPQEHVALILGERDGTPPVVRLHSECLTGDVLGSLKCDCGPQLHAALHEIAEARWGVLLYLRQEGRGIGLINKLRAYQLQDQGFDTVDANTRLGFAIDARDFGVAARMLDLLGIGQVRLLTNNPAKVAGLEAAGVTVAERLPLALPSNPFNERYLATKRDRTGHDL
ncbi:GTP cyclohydrolase II [Sphingobium nicotianae]|uniref:GTP cyclohydrolase-2 n=1 Tax=Sphingobium nicotianae TaxID=2782607 RepID=A0A9X1IQ95_9SPHN|nr:GTP cyclohydrolase II [Sphingobium nicotianae]MBT2186451.1 GTP cyclohydrolase II [Sphingobium nicotianae]